VNPFDGLSWPDQKAYAKANGYELVDGKPTNGGYRQALEGRGGYDADVTQAAEVWLVVAGCPAYHATVAVK